MGLSVVEGTVRGPVGEAIVRFLVDSGATYTLIPAGVWEELGLAPKRSVVFTLADGSSVERQVSECQIVLPQGRPHPRHSRGAGDEALLGVVTLEILGLVLNPFTRTLQPMVLA